MKADPTAQGELLRLAEVDAEIGRLNHQRTTLPELQQLADAEQRVRDARDAVVRAETQAGDLDRDIARLERDVEGVRSRTERDRTLLAGTGIGAKQASELQHELDTLARRQGTLEDEQLGIMEEREAVGAELEHATAELASAEAEISERLRASGRVGAGALRESRCGACRLELDRTFLAQVRGTPDDEVVHCDECGAILVRGK